jgi:hypothetical protein
MTMELQCIIQDCTLKAEGLVCVNLDDPEITIFMIPACAGHGGKMKSANFTIELRLAETPIVTLGEGPAESRPDVSLRFEAFDG